MTTKTSDQPLKTWHKVVMTILAIWNAISFAIWFPNVAIVIAAIVVGIVIILALAWLNEKTGGAVGFFMIMGSLFD